GDRGLGERRGTREEKPGPGRRHSAPGAPPANGDGVRTSWTPPPMHVPAPVVVSAAPADAVAAPLPASTATYRPAPPAATASASRPMSARPAAPVLHTPSVRY